MKLSALSGGAVDYSDSFAQLAGGASRCSVGAVSRVACRWLILGEFELLVAAEALEGHSLGRTVLVVALLLSQHDYYLLQLLLKE